MPRARRLPSSSASRSTARLPGLWDGVEVERVWVRGGPARLVAAHGEPARLEPPG